MALLLIVGLSALLAAGAGLEPKIGSNPIGPNYTLPADFVWSGAPLGFGEAHAIAGGKRTSTCYRSGRDRFCLTEKVREFYVQSSRPDLVRDCWLGPFWCSYTIAPDPARGNAVTLGEIATFKATDFLASHAYNTSLSECWDGEMATSGPLNHHRAWLGRLYLRIVLQLEFYPGISATPTKKKFYDLRFPIRLEDGRCDAIYSISSLSLLGLK